ncbi:MAG: aminodeoxychorismate/anthranilate synthase component II [Rubripirellula sp.]
MILLLDNYDSFVHNLARYFRQLGCDTKVVRSDRIDAAGCDKLAPDAIVISPGPRRPEDAGCSVEVIRCLSERVPMLGVCLGHQAIAVAFGGSVVQCGPMHGMASSITHDGQGVFAACSSPMQVGRYHSLAVAPSDLPEQIVVTAKSDDGTIMGLRHRTRPVFGVQFHPESVLSDQGLLLLRNFVAMTACGNDLPREEAVT